MIVVDDYSCKWWKEYLKHRSDADLKLWGLISRLETQIECKVKYIHSDQEGGFMGKEMKKYLQKKGITVFFGYSWLWLQSL